MRTGAFDPAKAKVVHEQDQIPGKEAKTMALKRYNDFVSNVKDELMVSGSDDFTMFLWKPADDKKPIARMTGELAYNKQNRVSADSCARSDKE